MNQVQLVGIEPKEFFQQITESVKTELLTELSKILVPKELQYLSADEVCKRLSITKPTLHEWKRRQIIKSYKIGARVYYRWDEVQSSMIIND